MKVVCVTMVTIFAAFTASGSVGEAYDGESEQLSARVEQIKAELATINSQIEALDQRIDDLNWARTQVEKKVSEFNVRSTTLMAERAEHEADLARHDAQCPRESYDPDVVEHCNRSANYLNARSEHLNQETEHLYQVQQQLKGLVENQVAQETLVYNERNALVEQSQPLYHEVKAIIARLEEISTSLGVCQEAIQAYDASPNPLIDGTMERMKAECGSMFDGN